MTNLFCFKHPQYKTDKSPDLSCKTCCTMFVAKIRSEQAAKFADIGITPTNESVPAVGNLRTASSKEQQSVPTFDTSWI